MNLGETHLKEGDKAPEIDSKDQEGNPISLADFKGKKVVLYFYPKDNTPTCTEESCNLRDNYQGLIKHGFQVVGVSCDSERKHQNFIKKFKLPFPLISDTEQKVVHDYGVWGPKKTFGHETTGIFRTTFVINEDGVIERVFKDIQAKRHAEQILETYKLN